jgi:hypothetical protein
MARTANRAPGAPSPISCTDVQALTDEALQAERAATLPVLGDIVYEALADAQAALRERERELLLSVAKLEAAVSALETALHVERSRALDLPSPLMKSVN